MKFDDLQKAWQCQRAHAPWPVDPNLLLGEVQQRHRSFAKTIFWRDVREIGVALLLVPVWILMGVYIPVPWTWYLCVPALLWIAGFMFFDRQRQRRREAAAGHTVREQIESSLALVDHQIWLLRNVLWWYLLPPGVALVIFFGHGAWQREQAGESAIATTVGAVAVVALVYWFIYWLNQYAVRKDLEPRQKELQALLTNLTDPDDMVPPVPDQSRSAKSPGRTWLWLLLIGAALAVAIGFGVAAQELLKKSTDKQFFPAAGSPDVTNVLVQVLQKHPVPAIAVAIVTSDGLQKVGATGVRKSGTDIPVTLDDKWHLGSDGKAMTAVLAARLVEQGKLKWDATVGETFPDLASKLHAEAARITLTQLLTHRASLRPNPNLRTYGGTDGRKERLRLVTDELSRAPSHTPGTHYEYSNLGYAIVGAMIEKVTGRTWEEAMREQVFEPLGMKSAGFGGTGTPGKINQPWGHTAGGKPVAKNGAVMDNPPVLGPAGRIHCTIQDWAKFIADQLRGAGGKPALLKPETYRILHTPPLGGDYALGWGVSQRGWGGGTVLHHVGDNTMNCANVWVAPQRDFAVLACLNQSGDKAFMASDDAISSLIKIQAGANQTSRPSR